MLISNLDTPISEIFCIYLLFLTCLPQPAFCNFQLAICIFSCCNLHQLVFSCTLVVLSCSLLVTCSVHVPTCSLHVPCAYMYQLVLRVCNSWLQKSTNLFVGEAQKLGNWLQKSTKTFVASMATNVYKNFCSLHGYKFLQQSR